MKKVLLVPLLLISTHSYMLLAAELKIGKSCPVIYSNLIIGALILSTEWYHSSRSDARYIPGDNATGIGIEIHLKNHFIGKVDGLNFADCDRYRIVQIRETNARLFEGEQALQIDTPPESETPFYDSPPLEHGYGLHLTPHDDSDKPWKGRHYRNSEVAIYDTPYVSDAYGVEGKNIQVEFETCAVCARENQFDSILACAHWGYQREYMGGMTGWAEPEFTGARCQTEPSAEFSQLLDQTHQVEYSYWINWR